MNAYPSPVSEAATRASQEPRLLSSWKDIADYLGRGVRTVQRWEQNLGLPVRRPTGAAGKSTVALRSDEVDVWLATRFAARPLRLDDTGPDQTASARAALQERLRKAYELRTAHQALTRELQASIKRLAQQCDRLSTFKLQGRSPFSAVGEQAATAEQTTQGSFRQAQAAPDQSPEVSA